MPRRSVAKHISDRPRLRNKTALRLGLAITLFLLVALPPQMVVFPRPRGLGEATINSVAGSIGAGYVANYTSSGGSMDDVKGFWKIPTVQPSTDGATVLESVGIGSGDTFIEVGTSQVSNKGVVAYEAWYLASPEGGAPVHVTNLDGKVGPGKVVGAEVHRGSGATWGVYIVVGTTDSFVTQVTHAVGVPSAYWLVRPVPDYPLANFGSIGFFWTNATINGVQSRLDQLQNQKVSLFDSALTCNLAYTGQIDPSNGDNFIVSFLQSAAPCPTQNTPNTPTLNLILPLAIGGAIIAGLIIAVIAAVMLSAGKKTSTPSAGWAHPTTPYPLAQSGFCSNCRSPLQPGARFCDTCGKQVS